VSVLVAILTLVLIGLVIVVVGAPLRRAHRASGPAATDGSSPEPGDPAARPGDPRREELESAREAKYREIRDAELDYRTGKLSRADYAAIDAELRAEAIAILNRIERAEHAERASPNTPDSGDTPDGAEEPKG
jgi:hypothetical protein